jgi:redox-sensitive bicupin YhaK (pirin superfamily)
VRLRRAIGFGDPSETDPFLLLDDFRGDRPEDYEAGFPWHPHRGMETITYVLAGTVDHADSAGNRGTIGPGDVQWMTAGSGIVHQEIPHGDAKGRMYGFQLWANLPSRLKMTPPRYRGIAAKEIPAVEEADGTRVLVVCGRYAGTDGAVHGVAAELVYLDVSIPAGRRTSIPVDPAHTAFAYVFEGDATFGEGASRKAGDGTLALFGPGDEVTVSAGEKGARFLFVTGRPLREPIAWRGPVVMNTDEEIRRAFEELDRGTFLKSDAR